MPAPRAHVIICTAVNEVANYASCAPWFQRFWAAMQISARHRYKPTVVQVSPRSEGGLEVRWDDGVVPVPETAMQSAFAAQCVRLLVPGQLDADYVAISDIDMLPLSARIFDLAVDRVREAGADVCVIRDVLGKGQIAMCYVLATPKAWRRLFPEQVDAGLIAWWRMIRGTYGGHGGVNWCFDQEILYQRVTQLEATGELRVIRLRDHATGHRRLDRIKHAPRLGRVMRWLVARGSYTDYHVHFPVEQHHDFLEDLLEVLSSRRN